MDSTSRIDLYKSNFSRRIHLCYLKISYSQKKSSTNFFVLQKVAFQVNLWSYSKVNEKVTKSNISQTSLKWPWCSIDILNSKIWRRICLWYLELHYYQTKIGTDAFKISIFFWKIDLQKSHDFQKKAQLWFWILTAKKTR